MERRSNAQNINRFSNPGLDLFLHRMGDKKGTVGEERRFCKDAMELVIDQGSVLAVAEIGFAFDPGGCPRIAILFKINEYLKK